MAGRIEGATYIALSAVVATGASQPIQPGNAACSMQVKGITTATVQMQASNNGVDYVAVGELTSGASGVAGLTVDGMLTLDRPYKYIRANVTAWTSGTITVTFFY